MVIHSGEKVGRSVDNLYGVDAGTTGPRPVAGLSATGLSLFRQVKWLILQGKPASVTLRTASGRAPAGLPHPLCTSR
jgi:hypothetical protein